MRSNIKELFTEIIELVIDRADEVDARLKDLDQKVEHLIRKGRNGQNHY